MDAESRPGDTTHNTFSGNAEIVVQFRDNYGHIVIRSPTRPTPLEQAAHELAEAVYQQWRAEARVWDVGGDRPSMAVRWTPRTRGADHPENIGREMSPEHLTQRKLLTEFLRLPHRRLVVLGGSGTGKTALAIALMLEMLKRRLEHRPHDDGPLPPVPVMFSLVSWDPDREEFDTWLVRRLTEDYQGLPRVEGRHPGRPLWASSRSSLVPILDGLDEMPRERQAAAVRALNRILYDRPLILTCRTGEFDALSPELVLSGAAVIEARPVGVEGAISYLTLGTAPGAERWTPLFDAMRRRPPGPVAEALSTPLMLWLCRTVYAHRLRKPAELADAARFPTREAVENHLLDEFVPTMFSGEIPSGDRRDPPRRWPARSAQRHLRYLAGHLGRRGTTELAWWRLHRAALPRVLALPVLALCGLLIAQAIGGLEDRLPPEETEPWRRGALETSVGWGVTLVLALQTVLFTWSGTYRGGTPRRRATLLRPAAALRSALSSTTPSHATAAVLLLLAICGGLAVSGMKMTQKPLLSVDVIAMPAGVALAAGFAVLFNAPSITEREAVTPESLMRSERVAVLLSVCVTGPVLATGIAVWQWPETGSEGGATLLAAWIGAASLLVLVSPWSRWALANATLAMAGRVPWRLSHFLTAAYRQGLLRRVGGTYQFRNVRLQERLAAGTSPGVSLVLGHTRRRRPPLPDRITPRPGGVVIERRRRRTALGPLIGLLPVIALLTLATAIRTGPTGAGLIATAMWTVLLLSLGGLIAAAAHAMPRRTSRLVVTSDFIECKAGIGRHVRFYWEHIEEIAVRRTGRHGDDTGTYGIHVRLDPRAPRKPATVPSDGDWYTVCDLGTRPELASRTEAEFRKFAGTRWRSTTPSSPSPGGPPPVPADTRARGDHVGPDAPTTGPEQRAPEPEASRDGPARTGPPPATTGAPSTWIRGGVGFLFVAAAAVPVPAGRLVSEDVLGASVWTIIAAVIGYLMSCSLGDARFTGPIAVFMRSLWVIAAVLSTCAALAVSVPPDPIGWAALASFALFGLGALLCADRLANEADPLSPAHRWPTRLAGAAPLASGYVLLPAVVESDGVIVPAGYAIAALAILIGWALATKEREGAEERAPAPEAGPVSGNLLPHFGSAAVPTALEIAWYVLVMLAMAAGGAYAVLVGGAVFSWIVAAVTLFLLLDMCRGLFITLAGLR
ncbi:NACHT domain-containing protein [Actinomadura algeriensis]|uniref:NACHT domain-containing protein n=1 Tax=Actinomadura algeriensis TaxID=1679523 RepID=A0ABR9K1S3_9ACTN|nr:hypothetical protein [Actinomadura algeriensis]MBE1536777.1 hypothetical protein [Actinomadura algeriensis]